MGSLFDGQDKNEIPVKLVEPSSGRIVELQMTETDERFAKYYMDVLITYAKCLETFGAKWQVIENTTIRIEFTEGVMAEVARKGWRK